MLLFREKRNSAFCVGDSRSFWCNRLFVSATFHYVSLAPQQNTFPCPFLSPCLYRRLTLSVYPRPRAASGTEVQRQSALQRTENRAAKSMEDISGERRERPVWSGGTKFCLSSPQYGQEFVMSWASVDKTHSRLLCGR